MWIPPLPLLPAFRQIDSVVRLNPLNAVFKPGEAVLPIFVQPPIAKANLDPPPLAEARSAPLKDLLDAAVLGAVRAGVLRL